jgi:hypothetical protein
MTLRLAGDKPALAASIGKSGRQAMGQCGENGK